MHQFAADDTSSFLSESIDLCKGTGMLSDNLSSIKSTLPVKSMFSLLTLTCSMLQVMMNETAQQNMENHPVIRTLYDHVDEVTCLAFHPTEQILASGSRDYTLKLFDYSKPSAKRAFKYIQVRYCHPVQNNQSLCVITELSVS